MKVIVVGGGVIGCSAAWELARAGCAVTLFERSTPGAEASSAAAGLLMPLGAEDGSPFERLAIASWQLYPSVAEELRERTGIDVEYVTRGMIHPLFTVQDIEAAAARARRPIARRLGIEAWDAADVREHEPAIADAVRGAMFVRGDHWVNNQRLVVAYAEAALAAGVAMRSGVAVSRLVIESGRANGVIADGERIHADAVLVAAGAWTGQLLGASGHRLPIEPRRGQMLALTHVVPVLRHAVHAHDVYLVPRPSGELLIGATVERVGFKREVTAKGIAELLAAALELAPALGGLSISRTWYGFRPWATDGQPVLGPWPGIEGLFVATGHFRNGILLAPITARLMCEWITQGRPSLEADELLPERFLRTARQTS
jgi:glycine oxidase